MRVVVVDDSRRRSVLSETLRDSGVRVVGETADGVAALEMIRAHRPQVALVSDRISGMLGAAVAAAVLREGLPTRVLILTDYPPHAVVDDGVAGWMSNDATRAEIIEAVLLCADGSSAWVRHHRHE